MHCRLIVLVDRDDGESSLEVRKRVASRLLDEGFSGDGGLFISHPADWFVVGGRWSGELTSARLDQEKLKAFEEAFSQQQSGWSGKDRSGLKERELELLHEFFPQFQGKAPLLSRDNYAFEGYDDDAQVLDETLLGFVQKLKRYPDEADLGNLYDGGCSVDLDNPFGALTKDDIGKKWCVVVDFHC